jgi:hypothetical protein
MGVMGLWVCESVGVWVLWVCGSYGSVGLWVCGSVESLFVGLMRPSSNLAVLHPDLLALLQ